MSTTEGISRRQVLKGTAATAVGIGLAKAAVGSTGPAYAATDLVYDVVVVGAGAAGFSAALGVVRQDPRARVVIVDARPTYGGTTYRSGGRLWVPNNADMRAAGLKDPREEAIAYMARLAHPEAYKPRATRFGLQRRHYAQLGAYYDFGADMLDYYRRTKIMPWHAETGVFLPGVADPLGLAGKFAPDYHPELEENVPKAGRSIMPELFDPTGTMASDLGRTTTVGNFGSSVYGPDVIEWLNLAARQAGIDVHLGTRMVDLVMTKTLTGSAVTGIKTMTVVDGGTTLSEPVGYLEVPIGRTYAARRGVIVTAGGFSKNNAKLAASFTGSKALTGGGCAVVSAVGDLTDMAAKYGFMTEHMDQAWFVQNIYEQYKSDPNSTLSPNYLLFQAYWLAGDSMIVVNRRGQRVTNEKANYNDRTRAHFSAENRFLFSVFDKHSYDSFVGLGGQILPIGSSVIGPAKSLPELAGLLAERLKQYPETGGLASDFTAGLAATVQRFNGFARTGVDEDFHRGESSIDVWWHAFCLAFHGYDSSAAPGVGSKDCISSNTDENGTPYPNVTMRPLAGEYYAVILSSGLQDTKGGPAIDELGRILDTNGVPVAGLYGAGNCIASPAGQGYWGAGGTLGPATVFGHIAGRHAARRLSL
ncbi:MAG TPA: FAD-dependent oxidoreductase [Mycobacteriales bacterium]|nr:FAD-dependent oxidoreductase [Mycobacteriales bacterium]